MFNVENKIYLPFLDFFCVHVQAKKLHVLSCILHISYSLYILHNLLSSSDDELKAPGTKLLSGSTPMIFASTVTLDDGEDEDGDNGDGKNGSGGGDGNDKDT